MKTLILAAAAAALLGAPLAQAAVSGSRTSVNKAGSHSIVDTSLSAQCAKLSDQFDQSEATHKTDKNYQQALALSVEGKTLCSASKDAAGVSYLTSAIRMIGMTPGS